MYLYLLTILALVGSGYSDYNEEENRDYRVEDKGDHNRGNGVHDHHGRTNMRPDRSTIVHLFEWKWTDIADECERFLAPIGYGGVQISPPSENAIIHLKDGSRPWYERYQPMSYILETRSGNEEEFLDMTRRCNKVGVRIFADVVVNHMTGNLPADTVGTAGSRADFRNYSYPGVPYTAEHFHRPHCGINDYNNADEVRKCELLGLKDLDHRQPYVLEKVTEYLNYLIDIGVAGFRVDAAKHIYPQDLKAIYNRLDDLNPSFGFRPNTKPYIYQEVIYYGDGAIKPTEYTALGDVTEFRVGNELKAVFRGKNALKWLVNWGEEWALSPSETALAFIDNHDTQRQSDVLTHKEDKAYKGAVAFMLAHPYGEPRVMSSYSFTNSDQGPPMHKNESIMSPKINEDDTCGNGWVCEHRWRQIYQMVSFRNAVNGTKVTNWWDNDNNQIAFSRGDKGFIAFNLEKKDLVQNLQTGLPPGTYCDVITGKRTGNKCTGNTVTVKEDGKAYITVRGNDQDMHLAIHVGKESSLQTPDTPYSEDEQGDMPYESSENYDRPHSSEHNRQPHGPPRNSRQPNSSPSYGTPRRNRQTGNKGGYNRQPNGSPGYNQQPNGSPGYNQQPNGSPGYNQQPYRSPGYNQQPNGSPGYNQQPNGSPGYNGQPNGSPSYNRQPSGSSNNAPPNGSQGRRRLPSGSPSGSPSYDWRKNLSPGSNQNGRQNQQNNDMQTNSPFGQPRNERRPNRNQQPNSQNNDRQTSGPFGQPRNERRPNRNEQPNSQNNDMQTSAPFGQPRNERRPNRNEQPNSQNNDMQTSGPFGQPRNERRPNRNQLPNAENNGLQTSGPYGQPKRDDSRQNRPIQSNRESQNGRPSGSNPDQYGSQNNNRFGSPGNQRADRPVNGSSGNQPGSYTPLNGTGYQSQSNSNRPSNGPTGYQSNRQSIGSANTIPGDQRQSNGSPREGLNNNKTTNDSPNYSGNASPTYGSQNNKPQNSQSNSNSPYAANGSRNKNGDQPSAKRYGNQPPRGQTGSSNDAGTLNSGSKRRTQSFRSPNEESNRRNSVNESKKAIGSSTDGSTRSSPLSNGSQNELGASNEGSNRHTSNGSPNDASSSRETKEKYSLLEHFKKFVKDVVSERG